MASLYLLVPIGLAVVAAAVAAFAWAIDSGQLDDLAELGKRMPDDEG